MPGTSADIERLVEERRAWSPEAVGAELAALEPLPAEDDPVWEDEASSAWQRADLLLAHGELIAEHGWVESISIVLEKMSLGDPGEMMRSLVGRLEQAAGEDELVSIFARALRTGLPGARWWAAYGLGRLADPITIPLLFASLADPVPAVGEAVCEALLRIAADDPEVRVPLRESLSAIITSGSPLATAAGRALSDLDQHERAETIEARALDAAVAGMPIQTVRTVRRCGIQFRTRCPLRWDALRAGDDPEVRQCEVCSEAVYFCRTDAETIERAIAGQCIAREEPDRGELPVIALGRPERPAPLTERQLEAQRLGARERGIREAIGSGVSASDPRCPTCSYPKPAWRTSCYVCGSSGEG